MPLHSVVLHSRFRVLRSIATLTGIALMALAGASPAEAASANRCEQTVVKGSTRPFVKEAAVVQRCINGSLRLGSNNFPSSCFDTSTSPAARARERASEQVANACEPPSIATRLCVGHNGFHGGAIPSAVLGPETQEDGRRLRCRRALGREATRFGKKSARLLERCTLKALRGVPGYGPPYASCEDPSAGVQAKISEWADAALARMDRACRDANGDSLDPVVDLGFEPTCQGPPACDGPTLDMTDLHSCALCSATFEVDRLMTSVSSLPLDRDASCRLVIMDRAMDYLDEVYEEVDDCEDDVVNGRATPPCPSAMDLARGSGDGTRLLEDVPESCASLDPQLDLGLPPICPGVGSCAGLPITTWDGVAECLACTAESLGTDLARAAYPVSAEETDTERERCREAIGRRTTGIGSSTGRRRPNRMELCSAHLACGQSSESCPDASALALIQSADENALEEITGDCASFDPQDLGFPPLCPGAGPCSGLPTDTFAELSECLRCMSQESLDQMLRTWNGPFVPGVIEDITPCDQGLFDVWSFDVSAGAALEVRATTTDAGTAADLCLIVDCGDGALIGDNEIACTFAPPGGACPEVTTSPSTTGSCIAAVGVCSSICGDPATANYALEVDGADTPPSLAVDDQ